jgi:beta-glucosidase
MTNRRTHAKILLLLLGSFSLGTLKAQTAFDTAAKIQSLIQQLTLEEKVNMIHASSSFTSGGVPRLRIPEFVTSDGPHGVRPEHGRDWVLDNNSLDSGTYLPTGVCLAATWNPKLGYDYGAVLGSEAAYRGKNIILGPGINIIRSPLNGRNFEYQSEDPYLVSKMVVGYITGVQDQGISACVKHYLANNQESKRTTINVEMSERALREIYMPGFKAAVQKAGVNTLMSSYNKFRGQWVSHSNYLLNQVLKKEWGFKGLVMSDWDAVHSTSQAYWNGLDLEMGTDLGMMPKPVYGKFYLGDTIVSLIKAGKLPEYLLNDKVRRILYVMYKTGMIESKQNKGSYNTVAHQQTAARVAEEGIVLLKNENNILPFNKSKIKSIAVIGYNAERKQSMGGGSSQVRAFYEITPLIGLRNIGGKKVTVNYAKGYNIVRNGGANQALIDEAVAAAKKSDVVVYVGGSTHGYNYNVWSDNAFDAEDTDKPDMKMPFGQDELLAAILKANPKTVVVLLGGGAVDMNSWLSATPAVLQAWYPGLEGGNALAKIIFGEVNPSGKLPMTFPKKLQDNPSYALGEYPGDTAKSLIVHYHDDIYVGYRYYDTYKVKPQFAFGHGLSYTSFVYSDLKVTANGKKATVTFNIRNTGKIAGTETAQLYVHQQNSLLPRPEKELKGFDKIQLGAGEQKTITIELDEEAFKYFNDVQNQWTMDGGTYEILVGAASDQIKLKGSVQL